MEYLFLLANLKNRDVLVIGGGDIAARKISLLKRSGAKIKVVAHLLCPELEEMRSKCDLVWIGRKFKNSMLNNVFLAVVATDNKYLNDYIYCSAEKRYKFVNVVDDRAKCSLIFPSIIDRSPVIVAISSSGQAPVLVRMLREKLEALLPNFLGYLANLIGMWRKRVKDCVLNVIIRRRFWEKVLRNNTFNTLIANGLFDQANCFLSNAISNQEKLLKKSTGSVFLVGAGPGDSGLFTLRGLQVVQDADVVLYDYLVTTEILDLVRRDAKKICVGKKGGCVKESMTQDEVNHLLVTLALEGNKVVRLKGGDPFIFGRGGEELEQVIKFGIPCQIVPGVTAASSVAISAGIPLTHRKYSNSVMFVTGHFFCNIRDGFNFRCLRYSDQTLVIYMGAMYAKQIRKILLFNGCDINTPVAVISGGTCRNQKVVIGVLGNLDRLVCTSFSPSLLIIGRVVNLRHEICFFLGQKDIGKYEFNYLVNLF